MLEKTIIHIDDNYTVEYDSTSWNLMYKKEGEINPETGKARWTRRATYHPTLKHALRAYLDVSLKGSETITDVLNRISEAENNIQILADLIGGKL